MCIKTVGNYTGEGCSLKSFFSHNRERKGLCGHVNVDVSLSIASCSAIAVKGVKLLM